MANTLSDARSIGAVATVEQTEVSDGLRLARYCTLDEMSGIQPKLPVAVQKPPP